MPAPRTFRPFPTAEALAAAAAEHVARCLREAPEGEPLALGLSGGSTPAPVYRRLAALDVPWARLHVFWIDERCVPPTDERSNERLARETLLDHAPIAPENVYAVPTTLGAPEAVEHAYDATLRRVLGGAGLTVAIMGMGDDGHTASLFPGADFDAGDGASDRFAAHTLAPPSSPVVDRITLTLGLLNRTRHHVFLVTGAKKAPLVARIRAGGACPALPAACIEGGASNVWFLDEAADGAP